MSFYLVYFMKNAEKMYIIYIIYMFIYIMFFMFFWSIFLLYLYTNLYLDISILISFVPKFQQAVI